MCVCVCACIVRSGTCSNSSFYFKISSLYKSVPTVGRLKICTVKCISNSLIHNIQDKRALFFVCLVFSNMTIAMILLYVGST